MPALTIVTPTYPAPQIAHIADWYGSKLERLLAARRARLRDASGHSRAGSPDAMRG